MTTLVEIEINQNIAIVTLNRPDKHNALNMAMFQAIAATQRRLAKVHGLRGVILKANGEDFCSGLDVKSVMSSKIDALRLLWKWLPWRANLAQQACVGWRQLPVPVMAAIQGRCWGGGLQIALGCDFRFATPQADFSIMESRWGLIPDMGGTLTLRECLSRDTALQLAMTAERITADKAKVIGLITDVVNDPFAHSIALADQLSARSPDAIAAVKRLYRKYWYASVGTLLSRETWYQWRILLGKNQKIAVAKAHGKHRDYHRAKRW